MSEILNEDIMADYGVVDRIRDQVDNMGQWVRGHSELATEAVLAKTFSPVELLENSLASAKRHKKGLAKLGGFGLGAFSVGIAAGAATFSQRR